MPTFRPLHFGALFSPVPGHLHPFAVVARELQRRGHRVSALNIVDVGEASEREGMGFVPVGEDIMPAGAWERYWDPIATSTGLAAIRATAHAHRMITRAMCAGVPAAHRELGFDGLLVDQIQFQGRTIADYIGVPFATFSPFIPMHRDPSGRRPPPFLAAGLAPTASPRRLVHRVAHEAMELLARPVIAETNQFAHAWGQPPIRRVADTFSDRLVFAQCPPSFDFVDQGAPALGVDYVGSLLDGARSEVAFPWERIDDSRPLVYVSLGTLQNQRPEIYRTLLAAVDQLDVQAVISLGRWRGDDGPTLKSDRHIIVPFAPQSELILRSSAVITHAGMNTTIETLAAGVPLVAVPITNDQPAVAKRVELQGAGLSVPLRRLDAGRLAEALSTVLTDGSYRVAAQRLSAEIRESGGVARAADLVEHAFGVKASR